MTEQYLQPSINLNGGGGFLVSTYQDYSVNEASVDCVMGSLVLRTSALAPGAGGFTGGGVGNKSIAAILGYENLPLSQLLNISFQWTNVVGPAGINYIPAEPTTTVTPYVNVLVDFDPNGAGDVRNLVLITDQLNPDINDSVGTYVNDGNNTLTYSWNNTQNVLIVLSPPNPTPGGVAPDVSVGASWLENSYKFSDLVAANPDAILIAQTPDNFPNDGGLPAGALVPAILLLSGDSGTQIKQGKQILTLTINNEELF